MNFSNCKRTCDKLNFYDKLDALENRLNNWKRRKLTLLGKISIVKSLGLSKLIFIASVLPVPEKFCDQVNKITFNFIWDNKIAKIQRYTIIGERENGGLNMIDCYFGGVRSKGFATLRNASKLPFFDKIRHAKSVGFGFIRLFDEVRAELVRDTSRSLRFFYLFFNFFEEERIIILASPGFEPTHLCDPSGQRRL